ncbi:MAG: glycerol acyltransferase [Bacteroidales bacterium]|nr:glycerol acyltransferase [Bacteroidales bacterium]
MPEDKGQIIDVAGIISRRTGKKIPRFLARLMEKFIHQDYINGYLSQGYEGVEFCTECMKYQEIKLKVKGLEGLEIPQGARLTYASNHPLGGADGIALIGVIGSTTKRPLKLMVNDFLMNIKGLAPMCVPVNKLGGQSKSLSGQVDGIFGSEADILMFPAGKCSRKIDGKIQDPEWRKTFITKSIATGRWIVPVHFIGQNSKRFYRVDRWCNALGIKFNLPMLFLPDELYKAHGKEYEIIFGKPIPPSRFDSSKSPLEWARTVREEVYNLH